MGTFTVPIEVGDLEDSRFVAMDALSPLLGKTAPENARLGVDAVSDVLIPVMGLLKQAN